MNKFFVTDEVYKDRLSICKECVYYFKPTGSCKICLCFMSIKARIGTLACPQKYWDKTTEIEQPDDIPQELIDKALDDFYWYDKNVFKLYYYEGNTLSGLAKKTGISRNSLFTTIDKVREQLKDLLNE